MKSDKNSILPELTIIKAEVPWYAWIFVFMYKCVWVRDAIQCAAFVAERPRAALTTEIIETIPRRPIRLVPHGSDQHLCRPAKRRQMVVLSGGRGLTGLSRE